MFNVTFWYLSFVEFKAFWKDFEGFFMDKILWITSFVWIFAWLTPIYLLLSASLPLWPRLRRKSGIWQLLGGGSIMFFVLVFEGWWSIRMGDFASQPVLIAQIAFFLAAILVVYGAYDILSGIREQDGPISGSLSPYFISVMSPVVLLLAGIVAGFAANGKTPTDQYIDVLALGLNAGLLVSLYVMGGLITGLVRPTGKGHRLAYLGSVLILFDSTLKIYLLIRADSHFALWPQYFACLGVLLAALFLYLTASPAVREVILRVQNGQPEAPFERRKVETRKRSVIMFSFMVLFLVAAGILMLESVRSDEEIIEATYLAQQQKIARSMAVNVGSLTSDLIDELEAVSEMPGVQREDISEMRHDFSRSLVKLGGIAAALTRVGPDGVIEYSYPETPDVRGRNISNQEHVRRFLATRSVVVSSPFQTLQGLQAIAIYVPMFLKNRKGAETFDGGAAMLVSVKGFSRHAFRNISVLNPDRIVAIDTDGIVFAESGSMLVGEKAERYLAVVFRNRPGESRLREMVHGALKASSPTIMPVQTLSGTGLSKEWIVAVPIMIAGARHGVMMVPIRSSEVVGLYWQGMTHQIALWASLLLALCVLTGFILSMNVRWAGFLESEVKREHDFAHETEGRFTDLVDNAPVGVFEADADGRLISANPALAKLLGYRSPERLAGVKFINADDLAAQSNAVAGRGRVKRHIRLNKSGGTRIFVRVACRARKDTAGKVIRYEGFLEDVTEQHLADVKLEESEKRYSSLFKMSPAGIYVSTVEGKILAANDSFAGIFGYESGEEVLQSPAVAFYTEESGRELFLDELRRRGSVSNRISIGRRKDGSEVYVLENSELKFDPNYDVEVIRGAAMDITELVLLQQQVEHHRRMAEGLSEVLTAAFEGGELGEVINRSLASVGNKLGLYGAVVLKSERDEPAEKYSWWKDPSNVDKTTVDYGASFESLIGDGSSISLSTVPEDGKQDQPVLTGTDQQRSLSFAISPIRLTGQDGGTERTWGYLALLDHYDKKVWISSETALLTSVGKILSTVVERDEEAETRHKLEAERKKLFSVFEQLAESVVVASPDGVIEYVNSTFTKVTGYSREEAIGKKTNILKSGEHTAEFYSNLWNTLLSGNVFKGRLRNRRRDGTIFYEDKTIAPVIDADGKIVNFLEVGYDVTGQISLEEQLAQSQRLESIGLLAGGIAHDFNNLLGVILGYASFVKSKASRSDPFYKYIDTIERSATRGAELTSQLLAFARGGKYDVKPVSINKIVIDTLAIIQGSIDKSIVIEKYADEDLPTVEADSGQIQQVLMNLCINSRDAMPGGGVLTLETYQTMLTEADAKLNIDAHEGRYVVCRVSDTGIGMNPEMMRKIFEPFFTTKEKGKGTGLGLSMVYGIVRNHGGFIDVESEVGKGTTFRIFYPASESEEKQEMEKTAELKGGNETVLVAEDEEGMRELIRDILQSGGYEVIQAEDGEAALNTYMTLKDRIDLVILDMIMPKMNGEDAFRALKRFDPEVVVLLSSGYSEDVGMQDLLNEGVAGFLGKPYQINELLDKVRVVLESKIKS